MRTITRVLLSLFLLFTTGGAAVHAATPHTGKVYVCPMSEHTQEFDKPGTCPICGMTLVEKDSRFRVAVLVFDNAEDIDFTAPIEVFGESGAQIFTVGSTTAPIKTVFGLNIRPDYDLAHAPEADLVLVPGGGVGVAEKDGRILEWLRQRGASSRYVMSVCNGAFILAHAGLLDGLKATTTAGHIDELAAEFPKTRVLRERVVDNGKVITAAGLSAGIDGALHVIDREYGRLRAERVALGMEYHWDPESKWTRSALADMRMPDIKLPDNAAWKPRVSHGNTETWETSGRVETSMSASDFLDYSAKQAIAKGWTLRESTPATRTFERTDRDGQTWITTFESRHDARAPGLLESMTVRKAAPAAETGGK